MDNFGEVVGLSTSTVKGYAQVQVRTPFGYAFLPFPVQTAPRIGEHVVIHANVALDADYRGIVS